MSQNNVIPAQKIFDAAGDNQQLKELLTSIAQTVNLQQQITNTSTKNVPKQAKSTISLLKGTYTVEIQNPGTVSAVSSLQKAQATEGLVTGQSAANLTVIYHQVRCSTSPQFNVAGAVQTFGGTTGSTQTLFTISSLAAGKWYFQIRSSYDGTNFNLWRNANGGKAFSSSASGVTVEQAGEAVYASFALPGGQLMSVGAGYATDGDSLEVPTDFYTSALHAIPGPNGYLDQTTNVAHGIAGNSVTIVEPLTPQALTGPADYPTLITMRYQDGEGHQWQGSCNLFAVAFDPLGANLLTENTVDGLWTDFILPGGSHLTIASGNTQDGTAITLPTTMPWVNQDMMLSIVSPNVGLNNDTQAHGIDSSRLDGLTINCAFRNGDTRWGALANWLIVSWTPGLHVETVTGGKWVVINLPAGGKIAFGAGEVGIATSGSVNYDLPAGFVISSLLSFGTPGAFDNTDDPMSGVASCTASAGLCNLEYTDTESHHWGGQTQWMAFAWL